MPSRASCTRASVAKDDRGVTQCCRKDTVFEYDGPRVFTARDARGGQLLAYVCADMPDGSRLLVVPTDARTISDVRSGRRTLRNALAQPWAWLADLNLAGAVLRAHETDVGAIPSTNLPHAAARLVDVEPLVRIRLAGAQLTATRIPASVVGRAVEAVTSGLKSIYEYILKAEGDGRPREEMRRLYDLPVSDFAFASFEVAFGPPLPLKEPSLGGTKELAAEHAQEDAKAPLSSALDWLDGGSAADLPIEDAAKKLAVLRALDGLAPPLSGAVETVEVSGVLVGRSGEKPALLNRSKARRIRGTIAKLTAQQEEIVSLEGTLGEFDKDRLTFILRGIGDQGAEQKCRIDESLYDTLLEQFGDDEGRVTVVGRRPRVGADWLSVIAIQPLPKPVV